MTHLKIVLIDSWRNIYLPCFLILEITQRKYCFLPLAEESGRNGNYSLVNLQVIVLTIVLYYVLTKLESVCLETE